MWALVVEIFKLKLGGFMPFWW